MITVKNYADQAAKIDFGKLSPPLQEGHKYMTEFGDLYEDDADIKGTIDTYLEKLNEAVGKQFLKEHVIVAKVPKAEPPATTTKPAKQPKTERNKKKAQEKKAGKRETQEQVKARHTNAEHFIKDMERDSEKLKALTEGQVIAIGLEFHKTFRATGAQKRDTTHDAKKRLSPTPENLIRWMKSPGHFDLIGVDTFERTDPTADYKREISKQKFWKHIYGMHIDVKPEPVPQSKDFDEHTEEEENPYVQQLRDIQNEHGGGLSTGVTGKYTSVRHELAKQEGKRTAGEAAKILSKKLERKLTAKEIVEAYKLLHGYEPEWHHAGFYKNNKGKSSMGRTFFFDDDEIKELEADWGRVAEEQAKVATETKRKEETKVQGFYYEWEKDYGGSYGKKRNYKVLRTYSGSELNLPKNFTETTQEQYEWIKPFAGKPYYGWSEPLISEFSKEKYEEKIAQQKEQEANEKESERIIQQAYADTITAYNKNADAETRSLFKKLIKDGDWGKNKIIAQLTNKELKDVAENTARLPYLYRQKLQKELNIT